MNDNWESIKRIGIKGTNRAIELFMHSREFDLYKITSFKLDMVKGNYDEIDAIDNLDNDKAIEIFQFLQKTLA